MAVALIPLKDLVDAKSRLAGLLRPNERRALAQAMVQRVLSVLSAHPDISQTILLSDDPAAELLAARYDVEHWSEKAMGVSGLNPALAAGVARLGVKEAKEAGPVLVLHADLPLLSPADIDAVLAACQNDEAVVIAPDEGSTGTNLLAFPAGRAPTLCFGANSFAAHKQSVAAAGMRLCVLQRVGLALDLDEPADVASLLASEAGDGAIREFLSAGELGRRLRVALASLPGSDEHTQEVG